MKKSFSLIIALAFILTSCSTGPGAVKILGIPMGYTYWGLDTGEQAKLDHREEFHVSQEEWNSLLKKSQNSKLDGVSWGLPEGAEDSDLESEFWVSSLGRPLQKEK